MVMLTFSVLDRKYSFWANLVLFTFSEFRSKNLFGILVLPD